MELKRLSEKLQMGKVKDISWYFFFFISILSYSSKSYIQ